jgi:hypothetical protein
MRRKDLVVPEEANGVGDAEPAEPMAVAEMSP